MENNLKWFRYGPNNPSGVFRGPAINVYIQAHNADVSNEIAENNDLYFDGCADGIDCSCCGDRWRTRDNDDGMEGELIISEEDYKYNWGDGIPKVMVVPFNQEPIFPTLEKQIHQIEEQGE